MFLHSKGGARFAANFLSLSLSLSFFVVHTVCELWNTCTFPKKKKKKHDNDSSNDSPDCAYGPDGGRFLMHPSSASSPGSLRSSGRLSRCSVGEVLAALSEIHYRGHGCFVEGRCTRPTTMINLSSTFS